LILFKLQDRFYTYLKANELLSHTFIILILSHLIKCVVSEEMQFWFL